MKRLFLILKLNRRINRLCGQRDAAWLVAKTCNPDLPAEKRYSFLVAGNRLNDQANLLNDLKKLI